MIRIALFLALLATPALAQGMLFERGVEGQSPHLRAVSERASPRGFREREPASRGHAPCSGPEELGESSFGRKSPAVRKSSRR